MMSESEISASNAHDLDVNGITLRYVTWGQISRPERAVLLIHGLTSNSQAWNCLGPILAAQGCFAIAPDLRGRGLSAKPPHGYGIPYHANDLLSLCDALGLPTVHVVGHSLGAQITIFLAAIHPQRVGRIVLVDAGGKLPPDAIEALAPALARLGTVYPSLDAFLQTMQQAPVYQWNTFWERHYRYDAEAHADGTVTSRVPKAAIAEEIAVNSFATRLDTLSERIHAPTLIVRAALGLLGPDRGFILPAEEAERLRDVIAGSRVTVIPQANHYTVLLSDVFNRDVAAFLAAEGAG
jgi:pimeloyl-ACP methyl ester carboxylesterase